MLTYQNPWKLYVAMTPGYTAEATADTYNIMRGLILTWSFFFSSEPDEDTAVDQSRIRSQLGNTATHFFPRHSDGLDIDGVTVCQDYAPVFLDVENYLAFILQGETLAETYTAKDNARTIIETVREIFPNRRMGWYGWAPHNAWSVIENWYSVIGNTGAANYSTYRNSYNIWRNGNKLIRRGGTSTSPDTHGPLGRADFISPDIYLPNDTTFGGDGNDWTADADCVLWSTYFNELVREAKRVFQKPLIPWIQPYLPGTTTYVGDDFFTHMLDTAYAMNEHTDGVVIYFPTAASWGTWRELVRDWVTANLIP